MQLPWLVSVPMAMAMAVAILFIVVCIPYRWCSAKDERTRGERTLEIYSMPVHASASGMHAEAVPE